MGKQMTVDVGISSDTRIEGKYSLHVKDTSSHREYPRTIRVLTYDAPEMLEKINELMDLAPTHGVEFKAIDVGMADLNILNFQCGECGHYMIDAEALMNHVEAH